jgi:hypothetical protein
LFPLEAAGIISIEAANVFLEFEETKNNPTSTMLAEKLGCGWGVFLCCCPRFLPIREALEADQPLCYSIGSQISKCLFY